MKAIKVGIQLDPDLLREAKLRAARTGKKLREVFEEALRRFLRGNGNIGDVGSIADLRGALPLKRRDFQAVLRLPLRHKTE